MNIFLFKDCDLMQLPQLEAALRWWYLFSDNLQIKYDRKLSILELTYHFPLTQSSWVESKNPIFSFFNSLPNSHVEKRK